MNDRELAQLECETAGHEWEYISDGVYQCATCLVMDFEEDERKTMS